MESSFQGKLNKANMTKKLANLDWENVTIFGRV